jgi:hypothetical protein
MLDNAGEVKGIWNFEPGPDDSVSQHLGFQSRLSEEIMTTKWGSGASNKQGR